MKKIPYDFPITVFEDSSEKISDTLTKKRVRIFYKGANRNGSYITEEFANKLMSTLAYAPVKGIYDEDSRDYTDHGASRTLGKIYGVVPENFNFAWEKHLDSDGVEREYACADVYLFTALYPEANEIDGKSQSMELYGPSIQGEWVGVDGQEYFRFTNASFLGLQVLGENAIPCFQGSAFFTEQNIQDIYSLYTALLEKLEKLSIGGNNKMLEDKLPENIEVTEALPEEAAPEVFEAEEQETEEEKVEETFEAVESEEVESEEEDVQSEFVLSDNQKQSAIGQALNASKFQYIVMDSYSDYAIVYNLEDDKVYKVEYSIDENDTIHASEEFTRLYPEWVTEQERMTLSTLRQRTSIGTYAALEEYMVSVENNVNELKIELNNKDEELSTLNIDKDSLSTKVNELENSLSSYAAENEELKQYKHGVETKQKNAIIGKYSVKLSADILSNYYEKIDEYTIDNLEKELAYELVKSDSTIFSDKEEEGLMPVESPMTGLEALISKYKK